MAEAARPSPSDASGSQSTLIRLAERVGIERVFEGADGEPVETSEETCVRLLGAMGIEAGDEAAAAAALRAIEERDAAETIPPVVVARRRPDGSVQVPVRTQRPVPFALTLEDGERRSGEAEVADGAFALFGVPDGYHQLSLPALSARTALIVVPDACWLPDGVMEGRRLWGVSLQLYLLRSARNQGIGDFADLSVLAEAFGEAGAAVVGLNPLHALFPDTPEEASPYSPASRLLLNVLNIAVDKVPEAALIPKVQEILSDPDISSELDRLRAEPLVDYTGVAALKMRLLKALHDGFVAVAEPDRISALAAFRLERGARFATSCLFLALRAHFAGLDKPDWHDWPEEYRDPRSPAVARFAEEQADAVDFQVFLQWLADGQLAEAAAAAKRAGLTVGLYRDLAVGSDRSGAETWANASAVVDGVQVGAPPDLFNPGGQAWGLPPFNPEALRAEAYRSFVELVRANMRHAGGLRIDHVMGLLHLYWIPLQGMPGAYVRYPLDDLVGILALESHRHRCLVVGEDLGTVPPGFRERMREANILSYRVLFFERDESGEGFAAPDAYPKRSLAVASSHDLATLKGWWDGRDVAIKDRLGLYPSEEETRHQRELREADRTALAAHLTAEGFLEGDDPDADAFATAAHRFLAATSSALAVVQLDDLTGEVDQVNVPATRLETPNWRRKYRGNIEDIIDDDTVGRTGLMFEHRSTRTANR